MPDTPETPDPMFPRLDDAQMARLMEFGVQGAVQQGDILYDLGDVRQAICAPYLWRRELSTFKYGAEHDLLKLTVA